MLSNTPHIELIDGQTVDFPRLILKDFDALAAKIVARRKTLIAREAIPNGYKATDLPRLMLQAEIDDWDILAAVKSFSVTKEGAVAILEASWKRTGKPPADLWILLEPQHPEFIFGVVQEIVSAPKIKPPPTHPHPPRMDKHPVDVLRHGPHGLDVGAV